jgi:hypothetical protein
MGAGRPEPGPGQLQERLGGGRDTSDRRRLRRHLQKLGGALQKVRSPRRQVLRKILRNKHSPSSNPSQFIDGFAFVCIHTSYIFKISKCCHRWTLGCSSGQWELSSPSFCLFWSSIYVNAIGQTQVEYSRSKPKYKRRHPFVRPWL